MYTQWCRLCKLIVFLTVLLVMPLTAADEIILQPYGTLPTDSIAENSAIGTILGRLTVNGNNVDIQDHYTLSITDNTHFDLLDSVDATDGKRRTYLVSNSLRDYEVDDKSYDITIQADTSGRSFTLDHTIALLPQNDNEAKTISFTMPNLKEHYTFGLNIATMQIDTNGIEWKTYDEYKVTDADIPASENIWWVGNIVNPALGTLTNWTKEGTFTYDFPESGNEAVVDSFYYTLYDSTTYETTRNEQTFMVKVKFKNISDEPPVAGADTIIVDEGKSQSTLINGITSVLKNDTDLDNSLDYDGDGIPDTLDFHTVSLLATDSTAFGTLQLNSDGTFLYTHDGSSNFADNFSYIIDDGTFQDTAVVTIIINPLNNNDPQVKADTIVVAEGGTATTLKSGLGSLLALATDGDQPFDTLSITPVTNLATQSGTITILSDGTFTYTHNGNEVFSDVIQFTITDAANHSTPASIPVVITPVSDVAPIAVAEALTVVEGATVSQTTTGATSLLANDTDVENDISGLVVTVQPINGTLVVDPVTGIFTYSHNGSETTSDSFIYYATDGTNNSAPVTVPITITPNLTVTAPNNTALYNAGCLLDVSGNVGIAGSQISVTGPLSGIVGTASVAADLSWTVQVEPNVLFQGSDTLTVVSSLAGTISDTVKVAVNFAHGAKPFGYSVLSINDPVTFTDSSSVLFDGTATYLWNFGDGTTSTLKNPTHLYAAPGVYTVTEIVTYYTGCSDTLTAQVSVFNTIAPTTENYFLDMNADGMMDRISLQFPTPITRESIKGISFHFTWLGAAGTVITLSPTEAEWIFPTASSATIYVDIPQGTSYDNVTSFGSGYGTGQLVSGDRVEVITMKDGMAPVLTYARIPSGLPNTLVLTYSENIATPGLNPQTFDLTEKRSGLPYGALLSQVSATSLDRVYTITDLTNAFRIKMGDLIRINPTALVTDLAGNIQSNPANEATPVFVPQQQLSINISGLTPIDPALNPLGVVSENLVQLAPGALAYGTAFDVKLSTPIENNNIGISFTLLDVVGNTVTEIESVGILEDELFVSTPADDATIVRILWSGRNRQNRNVGSGPYIALVTITDLASGATDSDKTVIQIIR